MSYEWSPSATLNNAYISNPVASPLSNTTYKVKVTNVTTGCIDSNLVKVNVRPYPIFAASSDMGICEGDNLKLHASGGDNYQWSPEATVDNASSSDPIASPTTTTRYTVNISEATCNFDTSININITVNATPTVVAQKSNDINCVLLTSQLNAMGADTYTWTPSTQLDNGARYNPIASLDTTTMFVVKGTSTNGCFAFDSITVKVTVEGNPLYLVPNAFTPNNDGVNDCLSIQKWGSVKLQEFSIYNRWGDKVFYTTNPNDCWDGTYKGKPQNIGTFVYVIRAKTFCGTVMRKGLVTLIK